MPTGAPTFAQLPGRRAVQTLQTTGLWTALPHYQMKISSQASAPSVLGIACSRWGPDMVNTVDSPAIQSLLSKL